MRTRIALVAITPIAVITASTLVQAVTEQSTGAEQAPSSGFATPSGSPILPDQLIAYRGLHPSSPTLPTPGLFTDVSGALLLHTASAVDAVTPNAPATASPPAAVPAAPQAAAPVAPSAAVAAAAPSTITASVDTVTPDQRAAWERVAMCEEGGSWTADGGRFSGGLGITRANWDAYGGRQFAPEGAQATEDQQIMVAERIQFSPPDQYGCRGW